MTWSMTSWRLARSTRKHGGKDTQMFWGHQNRIGFTYFCAEHQGWTEVLFDSQVSDLNI